jgi:hypothetical protein
MRSLRLAVLVAIVLTAVLSGRGPSHASTALRWPALASGSTAGAVLARLPLAFEPNVGQADPRVAYVARSGGSTLFLTETEAVLATLQRETTLRGADPGAAGFSSELRQALLSGGRLPAMQEAVIRLRPLGASPHPVLAAAEKLPGIVNEYVGSNPRGWHTHIPTFGRVVYHNVYPGIDLTYHGAPAQLEYDWILRRGADPARIRLAVTGAGRLSINRGGQVILAGSGGRLLMGRPRIYQQIGGTRRAVSGGFALDSADTVSFRLGAYDHRRSLVIDPPVLTDLGGSKNEVAGGIAVDTQGNSYLDGITQSTDYTASSGAYKSPSQGSVNAFVTKVDPQAQHVLWTSILGGSQAVFASFGAQTLANGIDLVKNGDVVAGGTEAVSDFPTMSPFQSATPGLANGWYGRWGAGDGHLIQLSAIGGPHGGTGVEAVTADRSGSDVFLGLSTTADIPTGNGAIQGTRPNTACPRASGTGTVPCLAAYVLHVSGDPTSSIAGGTYLAPTGNGNTIVSGLWAGDVGGTPRLYAIGTSTGNGMPATAGAFQPASTPGIEAPWVAALPYSLGSPYALSYASPAQGGAEGFAVSESGGYLALAINPYQAVGQNFQFNAQVGIWKLDSGLLSGAPAFTPVTQLVSAIPANHFNVYFEDLSFPRGWGPDASSAFGLSGTPLFLQFQVNFKAGSADSIAAFTDPLLSPSGALQADTTPPVVLKSAQEADGRQADAVYDPASRVLHLGLAFSAAATIDGLVSTFTPISPLARLRRVNQGAANHGGVDVVLVRVDESAPAVPTPTATPKPKKKALKCKKGYKKVKNKKGKQVCVKKK